VSARTTEQLVGQSVFDVADPLQRDDLERAFAQARETGQAHFNMSGPDGRGGIAQYQTNIGPLRRHGELVGYVMVVHDISELKQATETVQQRTVELGQARELDRLKSNFVNAVTHELRTPLTSIKGYAEFLEDGIGGDLSATQLNFVHQLLAGTERLERLVDDLLDFARIEAGTFTLKIEPADLVSKVHEVIGSLRPQADDARLTLSADGLDTPLQLPMDAQRIGQVLINLLNNAIKFTPPGGTITVRARIEDGFVRCEVADTGIGIKTEDIPKLFQRFSQLESGLRSGTGTGLGLSISKTIVEAHGGAIGVTSTPGQGSVFWFTLPLARSATSAPPATP
jgi:two-component system phosphate regulon sensor histidine kinase PhoR